VSDWWSSIERELDRLGADSPDPWADADIASVALTPEQLAVLGDVDGPASALAQADDFDDLA
jgi:hypothetical protein